MIQKALEDWEDTRGPWRLPDPPTAADLEREWSELVEPALPRVETKLWDNLLLAALWDRVLDDRARRMLFRMTLLRRPWEWDLVRELGEEGEPPGQAEATANRLRRTSLLEQVDLLLETGLVRHFTIHPATAQFVARRFGADPALRLAAHRRVGTYYEARAKTSPYIDDGIEAGHHLFQAGEYDRSYELLGAASEWLQDRGRVREGLHLLEPFLAEPVRAAMTPDRVGRLLGTVGIAYHRLGQVERAIGFYEQALTIAREIGDRPARGPPSATWASPTPPGPGGAGHRLLRAALTSPARSATGAARGTPSATWASPTPPGPGGAGHRLLRAGTWSSPARSATGAARGPPSATWASPTPTWARWSGPSASTSRP